MTKQTEWFYKPIIIILAFIGAFALGKYSVDMIESRHQIQQQETIMDQKLESMITNLDIIQNDLDEINQSLDRITASFKHRSDNSQQEFFNLVERMMERSNKNDELGK